MAFCSNKTHRVTDIHSSYKRAETTALLDSEATKNFMSLDYAKWLHLSIKILKDPYPLFNIDGTTNKQGDIHFYTDLTMWTGAVYKTMHFFLSNLGSHQVILGYPWFAAMQPKIDWAKRMDRHITPSSNYLSIQCPKGQIYSSTQHHHEGTHPL